MYNRIEAINNLGSTCEICGSIKNLNIHHIDKNTENNILSNLQLLCRKCHMSLHIDPNACNYKFSKTNMYVIDSSLWNWAQYRSKELGYRSVSEYLFDMIKHDKEENFMIKVVS